MVRLLARVIGIGIETADMLVREILSRKLRDRRASSILPSRPHITIAVALSDGQGRRFFSAAEGLSLTIASTALTAATGAASSAQGQTQSL
jgi:hypothetical protein